MRMPQRDREREVPDETGEPAPPAPPPERDAHATATFGVSRPSLVPDVRRFRLRVVDGPGAGQTFESTGERTSIGSHPLNDVLLDERTVSRFHCELLVDEKGVWAKDLGSRNGTVLDGVLVKEAAVRNGSLLGLGRVGLRFELSGEKTRLQLSEHPRFGSLVGSSVAARMSFALMERAAASDVTVLLEGETGTGKSQAAESVHRQSSRRDHSFLVVDCGALPPNLLESELFGHEKGAFTGATAAKRGLLEAADGGTAFLDEIGELPPSTQAKLLRAVEHREVLRLGAIRPVPIDVRFVAATNRDLQAEVDAGRFRRDLYFRLDGVSLAIPPLRDRRTMIGPLALLFFAEACRAAGHPQARMSAAVLAELERHEWPGNVRELKAVIDRAVLLSRGRDLAVDDLVFAGGGTRPPPPPPPPSLSPSPARAAAEEPGFLTDDERADRDRVIQALDTCGGNQTRAAKQLQISRTTLVNKLRLYRIPRPRG